MLDDESTPTPDMTPEPGNDQPNTGTEDVGAEAPAEGPTDGAAETGTASATAPVTKAPAKKTAKKAPAKKAPAKKAGTETAAAKKAATKKATTKKATTKKAAARKTAEKTPEAPAEPGPAADSDAPVADRAETGLPPSTPQPGAGAPAAEAPAAEAPAEGEAVAAAPVAIPLFQPPDPTKAVPRKRTRKKPEPPAEQAEDAPDVAEPREQPAETGGATDTEGDGEGEGGQRRRRRRGGRRRRKGGEDGDGSGGGQDESGPGAETDSDRTATPADTGAKEDKGAKDGKDGKDEETSSGTRRRRRRRRSGESNGGASDDPENTVVRVREPRPTSDDEISGVTGSTRLEAKKQRRREGREAGRRRAPIVSEAEFLARREAVDRVMVVRQRDDVTQIGVLEDDVLVEHYVARESQTSLIGNVYLGRVQNVLPSMEAAFIDIGKGRNAVLYAGEVNWDVLGKDGQPRRIETALKSGQTVLVQVTKDPVGHKGARLTSQISLPGRYLVYMPGGQTSGISRKLPDTERNRLKNLLKEILPDEAGVIIRTAAEGASEDELRRDVSRLTARWDDIEKKTDGGQAPQLLYGEPDLMIKVIRDLFTEDFKKLVVSGDDAWDMIEGYVSHVAPDLMGRVERWADDDDVFGAYRLDEQIAKALERKVWLPSGGSLVIDRTEAMTVVDVNTGKFTGSGGNLEETVTRNNLEAAEEIVRQLRLRDIGGIIVVDFIDMVLESNRDLVLRRLIECLGRDRTRHQVAEVTSLGLVQMTRKRIGTGLLEAFSEPCEACGGRGLLTHMEPVEPTKSKDSDDRRGGRRGRRGGDDTQAPKQQSKQDDKQPEGRQDKGQGKQDKGQGKSSEKGKGKGSEKGPDKGKGPVQPPQEGTPQRDKVEDEGARPTPDQPAAEPAPDQSDRATLQPAEASPESPPGPAPAKAQPAEAPSSVPAADGMTPHQPATQPAAESAAESATDTPPRPVRRSRRRAASRPAGPPEHSAGG